MTNARLFRIAAGLRQTCSATGISAARVLARVGLAPDILENEAKGVEPAVFFAIWEAVAQESTDANLPLTLGRGASRGPFQPALLAFSYSPDIAIGLNRLAVFKPLVAPVNLRIDQTDHHLTMQMTATDGHKMPAMMSATEIIFFLDFARSFTAHHIVPHKVMLPDMTYVTKAFQDFVGTPITEGSHATLSFTIEDAKRPLISADTDFYQLIERDLLAKVSALSDDTALNKRVQRVLAELLASGQVSADDVSRKLNMSKRSLQRKLQMEGTSFQAVLDRTRVSLAMTYLRDQKLSAEETSYLLAYRDPNSFYRAFHEWTGMTPAQARASEAS